jgi:hypothetical protein
MLIYQTAMHYNMVVNKMVDLLTSYNLFIKPLMGFPNSVFNIACRIEGVDWNIGTFKETGDNMYDEVLSIMLNHVNNYSLFVIVRKVHIYPSKQNIFNLR